MNLISQIVNELIDDSKSLNGALLKTKVLASRIGNQELFDWASAELSGYTDKDSLPEYRKDIGNALKGTFINGNMKYSDHEIPTMNLDKDFEHSLRHKNFIEGINSLENLIQENGIITSPVPAEIMHYIENHWRKMGNPYLHLISCYGIIPRSTLVSIISNVRSKLLDFMLSIETEFGESVEIQELKTKNKEVTTIMHQTIINNNGYGNLINTGNDSHLSNNSLNEEAE